MSGPSADFVAEKDTETRVKAQRESFEGRRLQRRLSLPRPSVFRSSFSDRPTALRVKLNRGRRRLERLGARAAGRAISAMEADEWP